MSPPPTPNDVYDIVPPRQPDRPDPETPIYKRSLDILSSKQSAWTEPSGGGAGGEEPSSKNALNTLLAALRLFQFPAELLIQDRSRLRRRVPRLWGCPA
ncbi:hypothetical protein DMENIID0001_144560 [Sergentomyia squamirostris]